MAGTLSLLPEPGIEPPEFLSSPSSWKNLNADMSLFTGLLACAPCSAVRASVIAPVRPTSYVVVS